MTLSSVAQQKLNANIRSGYHQCYTMHW